MRTMPKRLSIAGAAAALGMSAAVPSTAAFAAPERPSVVPATISQIMPRPASDRIAARGSITDDTPGNDWVAVQVRIERLDGDNWVTVVTGPRDTGNNVAISNIPLRSCTDGKVYRAKTNFNYRNEIRDALYSPAGRC